MKKVFALILAVAMILTLSAVAFADTYNVAYLNGMDPASYLDSLQLYHDKSYTGKKAHKEPKVIVEIKE